MNFRKTVLEIYYNGLFIWSSSMYFYASDVVNIIFFLVLFKRLEWNNLVVSPICDEEEYSY